MTSLHRVRGFGLIEVMVSLVVISIGLLGVAKLNALSIGNTRVSGSRSVAAIYLGSLSSAMHANTAYWQGPFPTGLSVVTTTAGALTGDATLVADQTSDCSLGICSLPVYMAAYDLKNWATSLMQLPSGFGTVACTVATPVTCTITVKWNEKVIANNASTAVGSAVQNTPQTISAVVQP